MAHLFKNQLLISLRDFHRLIIKNCLEELGLEILVPNKKKWQYGRWQRVERNYLKADENYSKKHNFEVQKLKRKPKRCGPYAHI